jgi:hypothetical protein
LTVTDFVFRISAEALARFQFNLGVAVSAEEIARDAITLYSWAAEQRARGQLIVAYDPNDGQLLQLQLPSLATEAPRH